MTAHEDDNMASRFPKRLSEAQISEINEKAIPINTKKATKFGLGVFHKVFIFYSARREPSLSFDSGFFCFVFGRVES